LRLRPGGILLLLAVTTGAAADEPTLNVGALSPGLRVDGILDETAWSTAAAIDELTMVEPREGEKPSARTSVRVLAGPDAIVFGVRCEDSGQIVSFTKERDASPEAEDYLAIALDTFQDGRSGYIFSVNPGGARYDALISGNGQDANANWDGIWQAATARDSGGWSVEIRIPIQTLSFKPGLHAWRFNVERRIQRLQEIDRWSNPLRDFGITRMNRAGLLAGLPDFDLGLGLGVRPSLVGGFENRAPDALTDATGEVSLDVTKRLGANALASLTLNTDFAETEVDTRRANLTRFPLFFPEKRTFFLDGADIFEFGAGLTEDVVPFFSRRVGLVEGQQVPIAIGAKATGRVGETNFGALAVRTRRQDGVAEPASMGVLRLKQNVLGESSLGFLGSVGDPLGRSGAWTAGVDFTYQTSHFRGDKNFLAGAWGLAVDRDGLEGSKGAFGVTVEYPNDLWDCSFRFRQVGDALDPSLGFVPRPGIRSYDGGCAYQPRPQHSFIRQMFYEFFPRLVTDLDGRRESYRLFMAPINWRLESGDRFELNVVPEGERLTRPFEIADSVTVPAGSYDWRRFRAELETASKRRLSGQVTWWFGGFYTGTLHQLEISAAWNPSPLVTVLLSLEDNIGRLREGRFDQTLSGVKLRLNLSPDLQVNSFLQYDTESRSLGTNTRLRWTFLPAGDLFVIYNHNLRRIEQRFRRESNELLVKAQYTFRR
jgi:hypothetical protein